MIDMAAVPIIRTEGKSFADDALTLSARRFVHNPTLLRDSKTAQTMAVETAFSLGPCLYFFAGHAYPDFGDVVLVYEPGWTERCAGGATPFDTGGLYSGKIKADRIGDQDSRLEYFRNHDVGLPKWRARFAEYLNRYFGSPQTYVLGDEPISDEGTGRFRNPDNDRRAWSWEVRVQLDHPAFDEVIRIYVTPDYFEELRREVRNLTDTERRLWLDRLRSFFIRHSEAETGLGLHTRVEREVAASL